jgi:hypothetical protein
MAGRGSDTIADKMRGTAFPETHHKYSCTYLIVLTF